MLDYNLNIKIMIATHKKYKMPSGEIYLPIHVGKEGKESIGFIGDNSGENISNKNSTYCELTALYWGWKNLECDYLGLAHYRRHFMYKKYTSMNREKFNMLLNDNNIKKLIPKYQIILPKKRNYYIETLYNHYKNTHYSEHLDVTREIIEQKYPDYLKYLDKVYHSKKGYMFNMFIMEKTLTNQYCDWLFDILFELENRINIQHLCEFQRRFLGRVSEIIFNCWLMYQIEENKVSNIEIGCIHMENINWNKKIQSFLKAKFLNQKYNSSF